jgi:hypothetical protein
MDIGAVGLLKLRDIGMVRIKDEGMVGLLKLRVGSGEVRVVGALRMKD